ncbi:class I SAM-dependent methyltransferase [bacterium]|nr:class I SAM-dependent methyltransferase [bacterium]
MTENSTCSSFWDESVVRSGHTGYSDKLLHRYDQPVRLATVRRTLSKLFPKGLRDHAVLDIGCGTGDFMSLSLSQGSASVNGVDVSPKVLAKAASRFKGDSRVRLRQGTVIEGVTEQGRYDLITSITVLQHHVEDAELIHTLGVLRGALKPDGRMIVLELAPPPRGGGSAVQPRRTVSGRATSSSLACGILGSRSAGAQRTDHATVWYCLPARTYLGHRFGAQTIIGSCRYATERSGIRCKT